MRKARGFKLIPKENREEARELMCVTGCSLEELLCFYGIEEE